MSKVIVTGAAGYIGGQTVLNLLDQGHSVLAIDRQPPNSTLFNSGASWSIGDFSNEVQLESIEKFSPDAIVHCAGTSLVGPSIANPREYYHNNFVCTKKLLDFLVDKKMLNVRFVFSSSAATYGEPIMVPCQEEDPTIPISPYGESKLMTEFMLKSYAQAYGLNFVAFRYFNACGADSKGRHGQAPNATHIIARVLESVRDNKVFQLNGDNFPTPDKTCIRDYVHVEDIAHAHILAVDPTVPVGIYNLGTSTGASNKEVIALAEKVTGKKVDYTVGPARAGDPAVLTASADRYINSAKWSPQFNLEDTIRHAWTWYNK